MQVSVNQHLPAVILSQWPSRNSDQTFVTSSAAEKKAHTETEQLTPSTHKNTITQALTADEQSQLHQLKNRDREVRAHEQAHASVGGPYAGAPSYQYITGPDGQRYAHSGHVNINSRKIEGNPEATLQKALQIKRAALAPTQPSQQDYRVAAGAQQLAIEARTELNALLQDAQRSSNPAANGSTIDIFV